MRKEQASKQAMSNVVMQARDLARILHSAQVRRESGRPFFEAHLEPVAELVRANGGDELAVAAAYLHDAIEDIGAHTRPMIAELSPEVLAIVEQLTERGTSWEEEKQTYIAGVARMDHRALLISLCDKITTSRDFVEEWQQGKFGKHPERVLWFLHALIPAYETRMKVVACDYQHILWDLCAEVGRMQEIVETKQKGRDLE